MTMGFGVSLFNFIVFFIIGGSLTILFLMIKTLQKVVYDLERHVEKEADNSFNRDNDIRNMVNKLTGNFVLEPEEVGISKDEIIQDLRSIIRGFKNEGIPYAYIKKTNVTSPYIGYRIGQDRILSGFSNYLDRIENDGQKEKDSEK